MPLLEFRGFGVLLLLDRGIQFPASLRTDTEWGNSTPIPIPEVIRHFIYLKRQENTILLRYFWKSESSKYFSYCDYVCVCVCVLHIHMPQHTYGGQRTLLLPVGARDWTPALRLGSMQFGSKWLYPPSLLALQPVAWSCWPSRLKWQHMEVY